MVLFKYYKMSIETEKKIKCIIQMLQDIYRNFLKLSISILKLTVGILGYPRNIYRHHLQNTLKGKACPLFLLTNTPDTPATPT